MKAKAKDKEKARSREKENLLGELSEILGSLGVRVRREKLKQGHGWRAVSGACRVMTDKMIFLDRRLPHDEQIDFLVERIAESRDDVSSERIQSLPAVIAQRISGVSPAEMPVAAEMAAAV